MRRSHLRNRLGALAATAVAAIAVTSVLGGCGGSEAKGTSVRDVPFSASDGESASVADFQGTPLVLNMWATWCQPCVREMPAFDQVAGQLDTVAIIGVNIFDTPDDAQAFAADLGVTYPQFTDPNGELSTALNVTGYPATAFFDADGKLLELHQGELSADELRSSIQRLFAEAAAEGTNP